jgi:hypothetical protein
MDNKLTTAVGNGHLFDDIHLEEKYPPASPFHTSLVIEDLK